MNSSGSRPILTRILMNYLPTVFLGLVILAGPATAAEDGHPLSMWQVKGTSNRVYLLGSIHLLRATDHPIPSAIYDAYADAEVLIMELDMDDIDPVAEQALVSELGLIQGGGALRDLMGANLYAEAEMLANELQIPLALLEESEPWCPRTRELGLSPNVSVRVVLSFAWKTVKNHRYNTD